jgi:hypothetical protein
MSRYYVRKRTIWLTGSNTRPLELNQELNWDPTHIPKGDASWSKWNITIKTMFNIITDGEDYPDHQYQVNVVQRWTACPDSSKFNDYTKEQLIWLHKLMTVAIILEENVKADTSLNREIVMINRILDTLYVKQDDVSNIKLSYEDRANALLLLAKYKANPKMLRLNSLNALKSF